MQCEAQEGRETLPLRHFLENYEPSFEGTPFKIYSLLPMSFQLLRSADNPWRSRGHQSRGTEMVRPSCRSAASVSPVILNERAETALLCFMQESIATSEHKFLIFAHEL